MKNGNNGQPEEVSCADLHVLPRALLCAAVTPILAVYVIFFISQWSYYVSAFTNVLPADLTYAAYAREGFFQLCGVSALNAAMLLLFNLLIRKNGNPTYFAADIAYHKNKFDRGFETLIDVWGADHHGHVMRMQNAMDAIGCNGDNLDVLLMQLVKLVRNGELVIFPTETVYGIGANALDENAVGKIFVAKGRPSDNPLIIHIADMESLPLITEEVPVEAVKLAEKFWPGPLTIILPRKEFALLELLHSHPNKLFTREEIYTSVWGNKVVVGDRTIDVHIRKLRQKIGDEHIITVKGVGYKFSAGAAEQKEEDKQ